MSKKLLSCAMAFLMAFTLMPCAAFAEETSAEGQVESLEAERPAEDDAFGEGGLDEAFFAEDADSLIGTLEADEESANTVIYLDQQHGADDKDGLSEATAVKTIEKANELANANGTSDIFLKSVYQVTGTESWDLDGKTIHRHSLGGYMIELKDASASLTLKNVVIDGARYSAAATSAAETDSIIKAASGGTIELKSGAILENNKAAQFGSGILANNGVKITMEDGAVIRNNTNRNYELGGGILLGNGSTFTMNGGEISGNTAVGDYFGTAYTQSAHGGAILIRANRADYDESYNAPAKLTMTGGSIQNNKAESDRSAFGGAVAILGTPKNPVDLTNEFIMTGGTISGNTAGCGGAISVYAADIYWNGNASVKISGDAEITQNTGRNGGGAIALWTSKADDYTSTVEMSGGTISENKTFSKGGGVYLYGKGDKFYMTDGEISDNEAKQGGGISISDTDAAAYLLGGTIQDNKATEGYPHYDDASERSYYGNAVFQDGSLYLDGTKANISGDIRIGCRFDTSGGISTNRFVALVGASDTMNDYELTSFESESLDGRVVVAPGSITYGTKTYSVADAEPYLTHFTHNHKEIVTDTDYKVATGASSQAKSLVLYGTIKKYSVTYTDGIGGASFADEVTGDLRRGTPTPAFSAGTPTRSGYTFNGWSPAVAATVTGDATYTAQWKKNSSGGGGGSHATKKYTLHYESNGGTKYADEKYKGNKVVALDKTPSRVGYTFTGWYADQELTDKITKIKMTSDKTVYAGWKATDVPETLNSDNHFAYIVGYEDGLVRPNADITRAEVAAIFFRLLKDDVRDSNLTAENAFNDVAFGLWHNKSISTMANIGILKGRTADTFVPNAPITRAEFAAICSRFDQSNVEIKSDFNDISGHWAENEIRRAASLGWIQGYTDGSFKPDQNITRAEAASMINRMLHRLPETVEDLLDGMIQWPDNQPSDWYYINMQEATNSHDFKQKGEIHEHWTKLTENPNWDRYR